MVNAYFFHFSNEFRASNFHFSFLAADQTSAMQEQMSGAAGLMPTDPKAAFKAEWEALEITEYQNALQNIEALTYGAISDSF